MAAAAWLATARGIRLLAADRMGRAKPSLPCTALVVLPVLLSLSIPLSFALRANAEQRALWLALPLLSGRLHGKASTLAYIYRSAGFHHTAYPPQLAQFVSTRTDAAVLAPDRTLRAWQSLQRASSAESSRATDKLHIVLITVDTLRADVAYAHGTAFNRVAARGLRFDYAFSPSAGTQGSLVTALHGTLDWRRSSVHLLDVLRERGYTSAIVHCAPSCRLPDVETSRLA